MWGASFAVNVWSFSAFGRFTLGFDRNWKSIAAQVLTLESTNIVSTTRGVLFSFNERFSIHETRVIEKALGQQSVSEVSYLIDWLLKVYR